MFAADSRTSSISRANLSVAALPVVRLTVLPDVDGEVDEAVFVLARVALRCPERCEARTRKEGDLGWRDANDGNRWTRYDKPDCGELSQLIMDSVKGEPTHVHQLAHVAMPRWFEEKQ